MASKSKKVRFIAVANGKPRQLFSVSESSAGDLTIALRGGINLEEADGDAAIAENRISIHVSPDSPGRTIKRTILLRNGRRHTTAAFIKPPKHDFRQYVMSQGCSDLVDAMYDVEVAGRDTAKIISWEITDNDTFVFHIFTGSKHQVFNNIPTSTLHIHEFRVFKLAVYVNYINLPAGKHSQSTAFGTSNPQINGIPQGRAMTGDGVPSLKLPEVERVIWHANDTLAHRKAERISAGLRMVTNLYKDRIHTFSTRPITAENPPIKVPTDYTPIDWGTGEEEQGKPPTA